MTAGLFSKRKSHTSESDSSNEFNPIEVVNIAPIIIPENSFIEGSFSSKRSIRIEGGFKGVLYSNDKVIIDDDAKIQGNIIASEVVVSGHVVGSIYCLGKIHVKNGGKISGNIFTKRFQNDEGSDLNSNITIINNETIEGLENMNSNIINKTGNIDLAQLDELIAVFNPALNKPETVKIKE
jgi:cytoskeletal protein CcmA (bactofilin family)